VSAALACALYHFEPPAASSTALPSTCPGQLSRSNRRTVTVGTAQSRGMRLAGAAALVLVYQGRDAARAWARIVAPEGAVAWDLG
jgi:hypothetical protein